jgi:hypothetical protein
MTVEQTERKAVTGSQLIRGNVGFRTENLTLVAPPAAVTRRLAVSIRGDEEHGHPGKSRGPDR